MARLSNHNSYGGVGDSMEHQPTGKSPPKFDSGGYAAIAMNARRLEIVENWQMPMKHPTSVISRHLIRAILSLNGRQRVTAGRRQWRVDFDISKASVTKEKLPRETNLQGILSDQQDTKVSVELVARLMWLQPVGGARAMVNLSASQSKTIPESSTPNEFDKAVKQTLLLALAALDRQAREELQKIDNVILP